MKINGIMTAIFFLSVFSCSKEEEEICYLGICDWGDCQSQSILNGSIQWKAQYCWFGELNNGKTIIGLNFTNEFGELREKILVK